VIATTTRRKSGESFVFLLFYGTAGNSYFVIASKGGAARHSGWFWPQCADYQRKTEREIPVVVLDPVR
jgi:proline iminopeptidase